MLRFTLALLTLTVLLAAPGNRAWGRLTRATSLDAIEQTKAVVVAEVVAIRELGEEEYQGAPVVPLEVRLQVVEVIKGAGLRAGESTLLRHLRASPVAGPRLNGFTFAKLQRGRTYLLFLDETSTGQRVLWANEDSRLVDLSAAELAALRSSSVVPRSPFVRVVEILELRLVFCKAGCNGTVWLLGSSSRYRKQLREQLTSRRVFVDQLLRLVRDASEYNDLLAAYSVLGELGERSILPGLVKRICAPQLPSQPELQVNTVSWLQGFAAPVEKTALQEIVASASDPATRERAAERLRYLQQRAP